MAERNDQHVWAIVLAGGEGTRVRSFLTQLCGGRGIKQFCAVIGTRSMLEHTLARVERRIPRERILVVVSRDHEVEASAQLADWPAEKVIIQSRNRDTAAGILLPLAHISQRDPEAEVAIFPADHFIVDEDRFMSAVEEAVFEVQQFPAELLLLGVRPDNIEEGYGWIEFGDKEPGRYTYGVRQFWEKPDDRQARLLHQRAAVWNTFVVVGKASTLWNVIQHAAPGLYADFTVIRQAIAQVDRLHIIDTVYAQMQPVNFSTAVCQSLPERLRVLPLPEVGWSDWGSAERILSTLQRIGKLNEVLARLRHRGHDVPSSSLRQTLSQHPVLTAKMYDV